MKGWAAIQPQRSILWDETARTMKGKNTIDTKCWDASFTCAALKLHIRAIEAAYV
jgi:hypothetical protein